MPDEQPIHPEQIDLNQLNGQQLRELRDAIAMRLAAAGGGAGYPFQPVSTFTYGEPGPTFVYGSPQGSFAYGAPQASFAYGAPQASFAYGAHHPSFAYGAPSFAYGAHQPSFIYGIPPELLTRRDSELSMLLLQKWDSALHTLNVGFRRVATGVVAGAASLASAGLIGANAGTLPVTVSLLAALFFDAWFVVEMLRRGSGDES